MSSFVFFNIDLNFLVVFDVFLCERSVGCIVDRLNLILFVVSYVLKCLCLLFDNELLVCDGWWMVLMV